jgi:Ser/Thr protein kinase RdoA (MazF antagonist)
MVRSSRREYRWEYAAVMAGSMSMLEAIQGLLRDPEDALLARDILGTDEPQRIADAVAAHVGEPIASCVRFTQSVGAVFILDLARGERVVLKIHAFGPGARTFESLAELEAVYAAQAELAAGGVACARVLVPPRSFGPGRAAAVMSYLDAGAPDDPHAPSTGEAMAQELARIKELLAGRELPERWRLPPTLFAPAHNALFDLSRADGAWIDERASAARAVLATGATISAMHCDFSCANVIVAGGRVAAIFDVDSVALADEPRIVASAAVHYTYTGESPWTWPSRDQARAFVAAYEAARGTPFDRAERARLDAAAIYALAYTARCQHGYVGGSDGKSAMCEALAAAPDRYFS